MKALGLPPKTMPNLNTFRVLSYVWKTKSTSRVEVAAELSLTKSTVTKVCAPLLASGLLVEWATEKTEARGRPRVNLTLNAERALVLGVEVQTDGWSSVVTTLDGRIVDRAEGERSWNASSFPHDLKALVKQLLELKSQDKPILGVGISLPGIVDARRGILLRSNPLAIEKPLALAEFLSQSLGIDVSLENDANCGCWGELAFGPRPSPAPFLFILCENRRHRSGDGNRERIAAVGMGLVLGNKPWWGPDHSAGEFSSVLNADRSRDRYQFALPESQMLRAFDDVLVEERLGEDLARNVGMLVNFLNLKTVFVSWPTKGHPSAVRARIEEQIARNWLYDTAVDCRVSAPSGGPQAIAWGAAGYFLETLWGESSFEESQPRWK